MAGSLVENSCISPDKILLSGFVLIISENRTVVILKKPSAVCLVTSCYIIINGKIHKSVSTWISVSFLA